MLVLPIVVMFIAFATATAVVAWSLTASRVVANRLADVAVVRSGPASRPSLLGDALTPFARRVRSFVPKSPKAMSRVEKLMASAGYHGGLPATLFAGAQMLVPAIFAAAVIGIFGLTGVAMIFALLAAVAGYFVPALWLGRAIQARRRQVQNGLPDAIDLLIVCVESGSGIDQALNRVASELSLAYPALAEELEMVSAETRAGKPRLEAFKNFAARTRVDDVRALVAMLIQTDRFGTSIGKALRTHAETSRTKRRQRAEEKAAKLAVKLLFPLVFCLFPAFYVVVLGPSMLSIFRHFVYGMAQ